MPNMFIGIVPLAGTLHKKYHNGFLDIPLQLVKGNYKKLLEFYDIDPELDDKLIGIILNMIEKQFALNESEYGRYQIDSNNVQSPL